MPHSVSSTIKLMYSKSCKYSFKETTGGYCGGTHTWTEVNGYILKKSSGNKSSITNIVKNANNFENKLKEAFKNKYGEVNSEGWSVYNWLDIDSKTINDFEYHLKGNYIYLYYNVGSSVFNYAFVKVKNT